MKGRNLYFVETNGYNFVLSYDGENVRYINNLCEVPQGKVTRAEAQEFLEAIEDDSSFEPEKISLQDALEEFDCGGILAVLKGIKHPVEFSCDTCDYLLSQWTENGETVRICAEASWQESEEDIIDILAPARDPRAADLYNKFIAAAEELGLAADDFDWTGDGINVDSGIYRVMTSGVELLSHSAWCSWLRKVRAGKAEDIPYSKLMRDNDYAPDEEVIGDYATAEEAIAAAEQYFSYRLKERAERFSKRQIADVGCVYVAKVYLDEDGCPEEWEDPIFYKETVITPERY